MRQTQIDRRKDLYSAQNNVQTGYGRFYGGSTGKETNECQSNYQNNVQICGAPQDGLSCDAATFDFSGKFVKNAQKSLANLKICAITCIEIHEIYTEVTAYGASAMLQHNKSSLTKPPCRSGIISGKRSGEAGHAVTRARRSSLKAWSAATRRW